MAIAVGRWKRLASENTCRGAGCIIAGWSVSPAVLRQFVSHSAPSPPPHLLYPPFLTSAWALRAHARTHTSIMNLSCERLYNPWGVETHTHPPPSPCTRREARRESEWKRNGVIDGKMTTDGEIDRQIRRWCGWDSSGRGVILKIWIEWAATPTASIERR